MQEVNIYPIMTNKKQHLELLLLADEQESMIDRYLEQGEMFVLEDNGVKAVCVLTDEGNRICELKNIAVTPVSQRQGYRKKLTNYLINHYSGKYTQMIVGTGDVPDAIGFYQRSGFEYSHRIKNFFIDNYDHLMVEEGILLKDMVYLKQNIKENFIIRASLQSDVIELRDLYKNTDYKVGDLIYDANIYDGLNTFLSDLQFYKKWLPKNKDAKILELCCGTGRLTLPIAKDGYKICGVDYTPSMLKQAKVKAAEAGLEINFIEANIRELNLQEKFDLIFIPFNAIHHLYKNEDLFKAFNTIKNHLKEEGLFLLDCFNPNIQYIVESEKEQQEIAAYTPGKSSSDCPRKPNEFDPLLQNKAAPSNQNKNDPIEMYANIDFYVIP